MLRSRPNRQQRPSESSDERQGRGGYHYGGYPTATSSGPMSVSSGADDDYDEYNKNNSKGSSRGGRFGGFGSSSSPKNKFGSGGSSPSFKRQAASNGSGGGGGGALILMAITLLILLSGTTFYYRKMTIRANAQLTTLHLQARHPHERNRDPNNKNDSNAARAVAVTELKKKQAQLQGDLAKATSENKSLENELFTNTKVIEALKEEMKAHNLQHTNMAKSLNNLDGKVKEAKQQFIDSHSSTVGDGGGIIPGGPGHTLNQRRELEQMNSIEDYEDFLSRREEALWDKIDLLIEKIGRDNKREALEWFGADLLRHNVPEEEIAFRVDLEVEYPKYDPQQQQQLDKPDLWSRSRGTITIEMAPLQLMPIAVNLFLQQIHHKLWDGCAFVINAMHILQAGPHQYKGSGQYAANSVMLKSKFEKSRLDKMPYQEYAKEYPHVKYTVGFAGRPGGPDFYINKVDNSVNHGPGGQSHHDLHEEADPCFGRVVGGTELINEINRIPVDREKGSLLAAPVTILSGRVIAFRQGVVNNNDGGGGGGGGEGRGGPPSEGGSINMPSS
jgi:cyclophilin family peptidyl-prolyl cis-trans isomerase